MDADGEALHQIWAAHSLVGLDWDFFPFSSSSICACYNRINGISVHKQKMMCVAIYGSNSRANLIKISFIC
jgi:hypothetical protein